MFIAETWEIACSFEKEHFKQSDDEESQSFDSYSTIHFCELWNLQLLCYFYKSCKLWWWHHLCNFWSKPVDSQCTILQYNTRFNQWLKLEVYILQAMIGQIYWVVPGNLQPSSCDPTFQPYISVWMDASTLTAMLLYEVVNTSLYFTWTFDGKTGYFFGSNTNKLYGKSLYFLFDLTEIC